MWCVWLPLDFFDLVRMAAPRSCDLTSSPSTIMLHNWLLPLVTQYNNSWHIATILYNIKKNFVWCPQGINWITWALFHIDQGSMGGHDTTGWALIGVKSCQWYLVYHWGMWWPPQGDWTASRRWRSVGVTEKRNTSNVYCVSIVTHFIVIHVKLHLVTE